MSSVKLPPPPIRRASLTPIATQINTPMFGTAPHAQTPTGTPGGNLNNPTQVGGLGDDPSQMGTEEPELGAGQLGGNADMQTTLEALTLAIGKTRLPDMRTVPKIRDRDANMQGILKSRPGLPPLGSLYSKSVSVNGSALPYWACM